MLRSHKGHERPGVNILVLGEKCPKVKVVKSKTTAAYYSHSKENRLSGAEKRATFEAKVM